MRFRESEHARLVRTIGARLPARGAVPGDLRRHSFDCKPPSAPKAKAHAERWDGSLRRECLDGYASSDENTWNECFAPTGPITTNIGRPNVDAPGKRGSPFPRHAALSARDTRFTAPTGSKESTMLSRPPCRSMVCRGCGRGLRRRCGGPADSPREPAWSRALSGWANGCGGFWNSNQDEREPRRGRGGVSVGFGPCRAWRLVEVDLAKARKQRVPGERINTSRPGACAPQRGISTCAKADRPCAAEGGAHEDIELALEVHPERPG
jgi:hypothetical protein